MLLSFCPRTVDSEDLALSHRETRRVAHRLRGPWLLPQAEHPEGPPETQFQELPAERSLWTVSLRQVSRA
ncbi:MAG: hypothetical protein NTV70_26040, partial [Acidobacteria bacterium]|nr:hypothetical protein [Acidobacteriota bacterium]